MRAGNLPTVDPSVRLDSDQICHFEAPATYHKQTAKGSKPITGRLLATSKMMLFLSPSGGTEMLWKSIMRVEPHPGGVYLELTKKAGNGFYSLADGEAAGAVIDTCLRRDRREIVAAAPMSRAIPQDVRREVWQRDQGRCVECSASDYLEFDHVIPHSAGGASTVNNVQLLCRRCNIKKSNRI